MLFSDPYTKATVSFVVRDHRTSRGSRVARGGQSVIGQSPVIGVLG